MTTQAWLSRCAFKPVAYSDTDDFLVNSSAPVIGAYAPDECLDPTVVDQDTYHYFAQSDDRTQHEEGDAVWDEASQTLLRASGTVRNSSNSGARVNFSAAPTVTMGGPATVDMIRAGNYVLQADGTGLTGTLNFSGDPVIQFVNIPNNALDTVFATGCYNLQVLDMEFCPVSAFDVTGCTSLRELKMQSANLSVIDLSTCTLLQTVRVPGCFNGNSGLILPPAPGAGPLLALDVSFCGMDSGFDLTPYTSLSNIVIAGNSFTSIDFSAFTGGLSFLDISDNQFTSLDLSGLGTFFSFLNVSGNPLDTIEIADLTSLNSLMASGMTGSLTSLEAPPSFFLTELLASNSNLTSVDVSSALGLSTLDVTGNAITSLDTTNCTGLQTLAVDSNGMTALILTSPALGTLSASANLLAAIDVSPCLALTTLDLSDNALTESEVDGVLAALVTNHKFFGTANLSGGTNAPPSAAGIVSIAKLEDRGWTVTVN